MTRLYIDFDGVLLDTWTVIYTKYRLIYKSDKLEEKKIKYIMTNLNWDNLLEESDIINDSINSVKYLMKLYNVFILTKVNSMQEKYSKQKYLNNHGINNIIFVDYDKPKSDMVSSQGNLLVDDDINNLLDWEKRGGNCIFFNKDLQNVDSYGNLNMKYQTINNLLDLCDIIK